MSPNLLGLFDSDSQTERDEPQREYLNAPFPKQTIEEAKQRDGVLRLSGAEDQDIVTLLEDFQAFVREWEYEDDASRTRYNQLFDTHAGEVPSIGTGRDGNALFDYLNIKFFQENLFKPLLVSPQALFFIAPEEFWAFIADHYNFRDTEIQSVRNVHQLRASEKDLTHSLGFSVMVLGAPEDILRELAEHPDVDSDELHASR